MNGYLWDRKSESQRWMQVLDRVSWHWAEKELCYIRPLELSWSHLGQPSIACHSSITQTMRNRTNHGGMLLPRTRPRCWTLAGWTVTVTWHWNGTADMRSNRKAVGRFDELKTWMKLVLHSCITIANILSPSYFESERDCGISGGSQSDRRPAMVLVGLIDINKRSSG